MAELVFTYSTMNAGKSAQALQTAHQYETAGFDVVVFTCGDRSGESTITSRMGIPHRRCEDFHKNTDFLFYRRKARVLVIDEAQFLEPEQVDDLRTLSLEYGVSVFCYGLLTDFRTQLFPASRRLVEISDSLYSLQTKALCWCGAVAAVNARIVDGKVTKTGPQVLIGDIHGEVRYEVLCRVHYDSGTHRLDDRDGN